MDKKSDMNKKRETIEGQRKSYYVTSADLSKQIKDLNKTRAFTSEVDLHIMSNFIRGCCQDRTKGINQRNVKALKDATKFLMS